MKEPRTNKKKPVYGMASNCAFMVKRAWRDCRVVLWEAAGIVFCGVAAKMLSLFMSPAVLGAVERGVSAGELVRLILWFTLALVAVHSLNKYLTTCEMPLRVRVRHVLSLEAHLAFCRTAFPHTEDPGYLKRMDEAQQKCLNTNRSAAEAIWTTLTDLLTALLCFGAYMGLLSLVNPWIAALTAVLSAVSYFAGERIRSWRYRHMEEEAEIQHKLTYATNRSHDMKLAKDIRIFGLGSWLEELFGKFARLNRDFYNRRERVFFRADVLDIVLFSLREGAAYGWLIVLALRGELTAAEFVLYFNAVDAFAQRLTELFSGFSTLHQQSLELSILREFLNTPEPFRFEDGQSLPVKPDHLYTLELRDVSFRYPGAERDTISHLNLTIHPGEKLAVVGRNGAGKTTLVKLLCGFYDPTEGQVLLDGVDIRQYNRRDYYKHFSAVFQDFSVLAGTMAENVAQTAGEIDRAQMWDCLDRAGLTEKIRSLPKGEDTQLGREVYLDGVDLSGGQLQRLMLARALYKNAPVVVLDEPTAALDPIAESDLYQKYNELTNACTSVYISHRLASTRFCDRILLVEDGGILEEGTHDELLERGGRYAQLFAIQSKYYQEGEIEHV